MTDFGAGALSYRERERMRKSAVILDAAEKVFREKGYHLAAVEEISRDSGFAVGTLYNLFGDKKGLHAAVLERIGGQVLARVEQRSAARGGGPEALDELIKLRLVNHVGDRLFFQSFSSEGALGIQPHPDELPPAVSQLHDRYVRHVRALFERALKQRGRRDANTLHLVTSLEAFLNVYAAYWSRPGQSDSIDNIARHIRELLLNPAAAPSAPPPSGAAEDARVVYLSRFDLDRLQELLIVARHFGRGAAKPHLLEFEKALHEARTVHPRDVPRDLVTMNSVLRLRDPESGETRTCALVFPRDADSRQENLSVLSELGMRLLGRRVGDAVPAPDRAHAWRLDALIYQPEAAGDFHL